MGKRYLFLSIYCARVIYTTLYKHYKMNPMGKIDLPKYDYFNRIYYTTIDPYIVSIELHKKNVFP